MRFSILAAIMLLLSVLHIQAAGIPCRSGDKTGETGIAGTKVENEQKLKVTGGPSIAFVSSNFIHTPMEDGRSIMKYGGGVGGFVDMGIRKWFSIQVELALVYDMSEFSRLGGTGTYRHAGLELPVYAMFHAGMKDKGRINIGIGPFTDFGLYGSYETAGGKHDVYVRDESTGLATMKDNYSGIAVKAGYEFRSGLQLNCCYRISLSNVLDENSSTVRMHPQTASFEIAYRF